MNSLWDFYKQTWWLWLLFVVAFGLLANYVTILFILMIPGILLYSVYFGIVRVSELNEAARNEQIEKQRQGTPAVSPDEGR